MSTIVELIESVRKLELLHASSKNQLEEAREKLLESLSEQVRGQLSGKEYGTGTANIHAEHYNVKVTVPKKVEWDESQLAVIYQNIAASGDKADDYIDTSYSIKESKYTNWPESLQKSFEPARTVKSGKPTIKIESE